MSVKWIKWHENNDSVAEMYDLMLNGRRLTIHNMAEETGISHN